MQALQAMLLALVAGSGGDAPATETSGAPTGGETVLYDFYADWCVPCQRAMPLVNRLKGEGLPIKKVNVDHNAALVRRFGVGPIPCFIMVVDGKAVDRVEGVPSEQKLRQMAALVRRAKTRDDARGGTTHPQLPKPSAGPGSLPWAKIDAPAAADPVTLQKNRGERTTGDSADSLETRLLAATVRLRVDDPDGQAFSHGTGTIIDAQGDEALILTCAHLFREAGKQGRVRIDLFCEGGKHGVPGRVLDFDLKRDVALVVFRPGIEVVPTPVAGLAYQADEGERVFDVGCSRGDDPTVRQSKITNISESNFPPNIQTAGQPVQGRSGGGLFNERGEIIGVCFAADPQDDEGLYATLRSIYAELDRSGLTAIYQRKDKADREPDPLADRRAPSMPKTMPKKTPSVTMPPDLKVPSVADLAGKLSAEQVAALAAVQNIGSKVVVTIQDGEDSREIVLPDVSPEFLAELIHQQKQAQDAHLTTKKGAVQPRLPWQTQAAAPPAIQVTPPPFDRALR